MNCALCNRKLKRDKQKVGHWIYSSWTGNHYCWPGEGCTKKWRNDANTATHG